MLEELGSSWHVVPVSLLVGLARVLLAFIGGSFSLSLSLSLSLSDSSFHGFGVRNPEYRA